MNLRNHDCSASTTSAPSWCSRSNTKTQNPNLFYESRANSPYSDISFTALQYRTFGYITNSMLIADILHTIYVVDFFINEDWYIRTIDICHDHFGFYLAWGSAAWLPTMYTLQVQYLARHPIDLSWPTAALILGFGVGGYVLFRSVNHQKNLVRRTKGDCVIWGKKAGFIRCQFKTGDGVQHESLLLTTGKLLLPQTHSVDQESQVNVKYRLVAICTPHELRRRLDSLILHVRHVRHPAHPALDVRHIHDRHSRAQMLPR